MSPLGSREAVFPTVGLVFFSERHLGQRWLLEVLEEAEDELDFLLSLSRSLVGLRGGKGGGGETEDDPMSIGEWLPSFDPPIWSSLPPATAAFCSALLACLLSLGEPRIGEFFSSSMIDVSSLIDGRLGLVVVKGATEELLGEVVEETELTLVTLLFLHGLGGRAGGFPIGPTTPTAPVMLPPPMLVVLPLCE